MDKKQMLELRLDGLPYKQIGDKAGVSRQRIQQLLSPPTGVRKTVVKEYDGYCADCGLHVGERGHVHHNGNDCNEENYNDINKLVLLCASCHRIRHKKPPRYRCPLCEQPVKHNGFCSWTCRRVYYSTQFACSECNKKYTLTKSVTNHKFKHSKLGLFFCSKVCWGKYAGRQYGFTAHPENTNGRKKALVSNGYKL